MSNQLSIELRQYELLRKEILATINWQNQLMIAGTTIVSAIFALGVTIQEWRVFLIALPLVVILIIALWLVEQSRMMRAGNFLQTLEKQINEQENCICLNWEIWLRTEGNVSSKVHGIFHRAQRLVISSLCLITLFAICITWVNWESMTGLSYFYLVVLTLLYVILLVLVFMLAMEAINHKPVEEKPNK